MAELIAQHDVSTSAVTSMTHEPWTTSSSNVFAALRTGIRQFDSSAGGLRWLPVCTGGNCLSVNVATEDVVLLCESAGLSTGINIEALLASVKCLSQIIGSPQGEGGVVATVVVR